MSFFSSNYNLMIKFISRAGIWHMQDSCVQKKLKSGKSSLFNSIIWVFRKEFIRRKYL